MSIGPGTRLGPYEVLAKLGEGGMREVYKARDTRLDRIVAIKTVNGPFSERAGYFVMELVEGTPLAAETRAAAC